MSPEAIAKPIDYIEAEGTRRTIIHVMSQEVTCPSLLIKLSYLSYLSHVVFLRN